MMIARTAVSLLLSSFFIAPTFARDVNCEKLADQFLDSFGFGTFYHPKVNKKAYGDEEALFTNGKDKDRAKNTTVNIRRGTYTVEYPQNSPVFQEIVTYDPLTCQMVSLLCTSGNLDPSLQVSADDCHRYYQDPNLPFLGRDRKPALASSECAKHVKVFCDKYKNVMAPPTAPLTPIGTAGEKKDGTPSSVKSGIGN